jgi:hypothetical protein
MLAIAKLYELRKEYTSAVPWFQSAFDVGGCSDATLERHILDLSILALKAEIAGLQAMVDAEKVPECRIRPSRWADSSQAQTPGCEFEW